MSDDPVRSFRSLREQVEDYYQASANHREKIPFLFMEHYAGELPESPPEWVEEAPDLVLYWKISKALATLYGCPLEESFGQRPRLMDHAEQYRSADVKPDHRLLNLSNETDLSFKDWCRSMETYLRERQVKFHS